MMRSEAKSLLMAIDGIKKKEPNYFSIYLNALARVIEKTLDRSFTEIELLERKRIVYYGVKMLNNQKTDGMTYEQLRRRFEQFELTKMFISTLTPLDLESIFPIEKDFKGKRFGTKDYFFTKKVLIQHGENKTIGEKVDDLLWDYHNWDITEFYVNLLSVISDMRRAEGQKGLAEEFFEEKGLTTYTLVKEGKKQFIINNTTGEKARVKKPVPRYMKLIKKNSPS